MRGAGSAFALGLALCALVGLGAARCGPPSPDERPLHQIGLGSEVTIAPSPKNPGAFVFRGALFDLATGNVVMERSALVRPGEPVRFSSFDPETFERYWFSVTVAPSLEVADYQLGLVRERREVTLHKGSVSLPAP